VATLRQRQGAYFVDYYLNDKRIRKNVGRSKKLAELALKNIEAKITKGEPGFEKKDKELTALFESFLSYSKTHHSPGTHKRYRAIMDNFKGYLGNYPFIKKISHLTPKTFNDYKQFRRGEEAQNKAINTELRTLRTMLALAKTRGYIKENPTDGVRFLNK